MTQQLLRELAKQGNVKALALLLQVGLQTQGLTVKAAIQKGSLGSIPILQEDKRKGILFAKLTRE